MLQFERKERLGIFEEISFTQKNFAKTPRLDSSTTSYCYSAKYSTLA
jgi:hypothetical protein